MPSVYEQPGRRVVLTVPVLTEVGAHRLWEERGKPLGDDWIDWFAAETNIKKILEDLAPANPSIPKGVPDTQ